MSIVGAGVAAFERMINRMLALDPELVEGLSDFADKRVAVIVEGLDLQLCLRPGSAGVAVESWGSQAVPQADVTIRGSVVELASLARLAFEARDERDATLPEAVQVHGDVALVQQLLALVGRADLDWEEWISRRTGDVAGHQIARGLRGVVSWGGSVRRQLERNFAEYLREEAELVPDRHRVGSFASDVDRLRDDVERLEQRLDRLPRRDQGHPPRDRP